MDMKERIGYGVGTVISAILIIGSWKGWFPMTEIEVFGFITGALCVWLTVKENIWNWPIGIANSVFFVVLFWRSRLFADMGLNVLYVILGFLGWYWWLYGGKNKSELRVQNVDAFTMTWLTIVAIFFTWGATVYLRSIADISPFWDALTTAISLVAQYLLTKKFIENWYLWITTDIIYVFLYFYKDLYLTGILYAIFMVMCFAGLKDWHKTQIHAQKHEI